MKVRELVAELAELDPELEVVCYTEEEDLLLPEHLFRVLSIESVDTGEGEKVRDAQDLLTLKLGRSTASQRLAFLHVTTHF